MNRDIVSVIIPTYNRADVMKESVQSILNQTHQNLEVLIIDDCSTDNTKAVISEIIDSRVIYIRLEENRGANFARNYGVTQAKGAFIAFQDSDDIWHKDKLEKELSFLKANNYDIIGCSFIRNVGNTKTKYPKDEIKGDLLRRCLEENILSTQTILGYKKCFLEETFNENLKRFQDWEIAIRLIKRFHVGFLNEILVDVYLQADSISNKSDIAVESLEYIIELNKEDMIRYKLEEVLYYKMFGFAMRADRKDIAKDYLKKLYQTTGKAKYIVYLLSLKSGILSLLYKRRA